MNEADAHEQARRTRSGSAKRQRQCVGRMRCTEAEYAQLEAAAERAGLSLGSFMRYQCLGTPGPRAVKRPPVEREALAQLLAQLGKCGSNVNQIARQLNSGRDAREVDDLAVTLRAVWEMRDAVLLALGMKASTGGHSVTTERR